MIRCNGGESPVRCHMSLLLQKIFWKLSGDTISKESISYSPAFLIIEESTGKLS